MRERSRTVRQSLTERRIDAIPRSDRRQIIYDKTQPGLGLKVEPTGKNSWFWFRSVAGKPTWKTLGHYPETSLDAARTAAQALNVALDRWVAGGSRGASPFAAPKTELTFSELVDAYCERHVRAKASHPEFAEHKTRWMFDKYLSGWKKRRLSAMLRDDVRRLHEELGRDSGHHQANRVMQLLRAMFNFALDAELWEGANPVRVRRFYEPKRTTFIPLEDKDRFLEAVRTEPNRDLADFIMLSLITAARKADVVSMKWSDIADERWTIPFPKGRKSYTVPLRGEALKILADRRKHLGADFPSPYVFPSWGKSGHCVDFKAPWSKFLKRVGFVGLRQHDLRRSTASWAAISGVPLLTISKMLGHASIAMTQVYAHLNEDTVRSGFEAALTAGKKKPKRLPAPK